MGKFSRSVARGRRAIGLAAMNYRERGARSLFPTDGSPSLILDFVPTAGTAGYTLDLTFVQPLSAYAADGSLRADFVNGTYAAASASEPSFAAHVPDPLTGGITNFQVWS